MSTPDGADTDFEGLKDIRGRRRSPATYPGARKGKPPPNKGRRTGGVTYGWNEVMKLLDAIPTSAPPQIRNRAVFVFLWRTGVGVKEMQRVRLMDLDESTATVHIRRTPERREREVYILGSAADPQWGWKALAPWLETRAEQGIVRGAPLFCVTEGPSRGRAVASSDLRKSVKDYAKAAKLHGQFTLSGFRNTVAVEMYNAGVSITRIQRQLGHATLAATLEGLERLGAVQTLDDLRDYDPEGAGGAPRAHVDMPTDAREPFDEARAVVDKSPRAAAALLRLALQQIVIFLGEPGQDLNKDIGSLVQKGLSVEVQQALDTVRVIGNESVHPGTIDMNDNADTAIALFSLVNFIVDQRISQPMRLEALYSTLPPAKLQGIEARDKQLKRPV
jgi:hypothetical protein